MKNTKSCLITLLLVFSVVFSGCGETVNHSLYKVPKNDRYYYQALRNQREKNLLEARRLFALSAKKSSSYIARRSAENLTELGNIRERLEACEQLVKKYKDEEALLIAAKQFSAAEEYTKVLNLTNDVDYAGSLNSLIYLRLDAMAKNNAMNLYKDTYTWFLSRPVSSEHYKFYCDIAKERSFIEDKEYALLIDFRIEVYKKNHLRAFEKLQTYGEKFPLEPQVLSDMGKVCIYGSNNYLQNAKFFDELIEKSKGSEAEFYAAFYAGRLYEKADYLSYATNRYKVAMEVSKSDSQYDNALWYLLDLNLRKSTSQGIKMIKEYCSTWHNPSYFDDIFDMLSPLMLSEGRWADFQTLYKAIDGYASDGMTAKFAYIYGRLVQEKIILPSIDDTHSSEDDAAFTRALVSGSDVYYRVLAVNQLGLGGRQAEDVLCNNRVNKDEPIDMEAENLLLGYVSFGFPEKIYSEWLLLNNNGCKIGYDTGIKIARFLETCGKNKNEYYPQALRIAAKVIAGSNKPVSKEDLKLLYPRDYSDIVRSKCAKYNVPEEIMYALIRSESFFDSQIESSAGAIGLTQLMSFTGSDIAHRLKYNDYSLKNPDDNIEFGTWYLNNLAGRLENKWLPAFFSYNAGITRVRRWMNSSKVAFNNIRHLPDDLFLETIPYEETREYGRKLVGAAAMYAWLYYNKEISQEISEIVN